MVAVNGGVGKPATSAQEVHDDKTTMSPQDEAFLAQEELDLEIFGLNDNVITDTTTEEAEDDFVSTTTTTNEDTTIPPILDEIYDDDAAEFEEDFGTPINSEPEVVYDPLDDIVEISSVTSLPDNVELFEIAEFTTVVSTYNNVEGQQRLFDKTTIAYPLGNVQLEFTLCHHIKFILLQMTKMKQFDLKQ